MTDPFDRLMSELKALGTRPDPAHLDRVLTMAEARMEEIEKNSQENPDLARPTCNPFQERGAHRAAEWMSLMSKKLKLLLLGSSGLVTAGLAVFLVMPQAETGSLSHPTALETTHQGRPHNTDHILTKSEPSTIGRIAEGVGELIDGFSSPARRPQADVAHGAPRGPQTLQRSETPALEGRPVMSKRTVMAPTAQMLAAPADSTVLSEPVNRDRFDGRNSNAVKSVTTEPVSTFSIDVDTASYATLRSYLERGQIPSPDALRIEEMVNYFSYDYAAPAPGGAPFSVDAINYPTPWNPGTEIVRIGLQGVLPQIDERPPLDLVFLVDTSGSMRSPEKLGLLKQSLKMMLPDMRAGDRIGIVTYAGSAGVALDMVDATDRSRIEAALEGLAAGGSTAGAAGLRSAYDLLEREKSSDRISRVILATDGDFNVGMSSLEEMKRFIETKRDSGAYLSVLGFGRGNYNDALMQTLAQNGNGQAAYIDTLWEARKVLVDQLTGTLFPIAGDVKVQVEFNPAVVSEYRLIGYETRILAREDFKNDKVDAGDIGAGHQVTALYEITPVGSPAERFEPTRYGQAEAPAPVVASDTEELGFLRLRYKTPGEMTSKLIEAPISTAVEPMDTDAAFATAIAGWGQLMKDDSMLGDWSTAQAIELARSGRGEDLFGYRAEAIRLMGIQDALSR